MSRQVIATPEAPKAIGPYSQAIAVAPARMVFLSGQVPLDPATGAMVAGDIEVQVERVMKNLSGVLAAAQLGFDHVVRTTLYLTDLSEFTRVNDVYARYFSEAPPARATVQVAALPRGAKIEIDAIAVG
jgi:2-iminobutanoate/2-iminopropanoate deaminase